MTRDDFATLWKMLTGVWPRLDTDETVAAWYGLIGQYPAQHAHAAVRRWASDRRQAPTPADVIAGIKAIAAEARQSPERQIARARCDECDNEGFVFLSFDGHGTVRRCSRGCKPPLPETRRADEPRASRADGALWSRRLAETRAAAARRRSEIGDRAYLAERGADPDRHRIVNGMIVKKPT